MMTKSSLLRSTLAASILVSAACGGDDGLVRVRPRIVTEPPAGTELVFGEVVLGRSETDPVIVVVGNVGEGPLELEAVRIEGAAASHFRISSHPRALAPGQRGEVFVRFEPTAFGDHSATLIIESNDTATPEVRFPIRGPAREACRISMGPPHQSFLLGEIRTVTVTAESSFECKIVRIFTDRNLFDVVDEPELPVVIPPGGSLALDVQHVNVSHAPGIPVRELRVKESEGSEIAVTFEGEPPVYGCLSVFPPRLLFPTTDLGMRPSQRVTVSNACTKDAFVSSAVVSNGYYFFTVEGTYPQVVPPLGEIDVVVSYQPFSPVGDIGKLNINTNDGQNPRFVIDLYGEAAVPSISTFPNQLDFGSVVFKNPQGVELRSECASRTQYVQIYSTGDADLVVDRLEIEGGGDDLFLVTSVTVNGTPVPSFDQPVVVPTDQEMRVFVQFYPTRFDPPGHRGKLLIHHNASPDPHEVVLVGNGVMDGGTTDTFQQLAGPKLDILWVIDNSCSMYDEQARLIDNLSQFVGYADSQNADYQMAVIDTDSRSRNAGKLRRCFPHPSVIGSDYADTETREEAFECIFDIGTTGSGIEAGLGAAMRALERAVDPNNSDPANNPNAALIRDDAKLVIVVLSDEEDQSLEPQYVIRDFYFSVKGSHRPDRVSVHAIAGPTQEECQTGPRGSSPGYRYEWMTQQTGGIFFNICLEDWQPVLTDLGLSVFTPTDEWDLSQAADPSSLVVTVDGALVARSTTDGYAYNPNGNSIKFYGTALPQPGAEIVATYNGLCRP
jgi:hypothetical protein